MNFITVDVYDESGQRRVLKMTPDEARALGERLIRANDDGVPEARTDELLALTPLGAWVLSERRREANNS